MSYTPRSSFPLALPPADLAIPPPVYRRPALITTYSHLPDRSIRHDDSSMVYYSPAPLGSDLNYGFERRIERDESIVEHLDGLCEALREVEERGDQAERRGGIITWRGMVTRIMTAPFEDREGWEMTALALDGSVYLEQYEPPETKAKRTRGQGDYARQTYMGYSYESFSTIPTEGVEPRDDDPDGWSGDVNTNVQWCNVVRSAIGEYPLCLGGEVDCVEAEVGDDHPGLDKCVELKTNKVIENERQEAVFHKKLLKHWAQSWLLGVPTVEIGFRTEAGVVQSRRKFNTESIPAFIAATQRPQWSPAPCLHFLNATIQHLLFHVLPTDPTPEYGLTEDDPLPAAAVWRLRFTPRRGIELFRLDRYDEAAGQWGGVLPEDYVRWRMGRR